MKGMRQSTPQKPFGRFFKVLGPGLITGAADDDPSGIATYSIAGAQHGTRCFGRRRSPGR
jgi:Mn2+/Fe2+ NRAMP family transporter